jgi:MFS family permease
VPLILGSFLTAAAFVVLAVGHSSWDVYVAAALMGIGIGFAFAALANLIVEAVPREQTGVATGMNTIVRTIGGAIGAEVAASVLAANVLRSGFPDRHGYTVTFLLCALVVAVGVLASLAVPGRPRAPRRGVAMREPASAVE